MSIPSPEDYARREAERRAPFEHLRDLAKKGYDPVTQGICQRPPKAGDQIGMACGVCGHNNVLHPHPVGNPTLTDCVACSLLVTQRQFQQALDILRGAP